MYTFFIAFSLVLIPDIISTCGLKSARIMNGENATIWPWMVSLQEFIEQDAKLIRSHFCGGSLISDQVVLTAAHCFLSPKNFLIKVGSNNLYDLNENNKIYEASDVIIHENYNKTTKENDVALIKLKEKVVLSNEVSPICLPKPSDDNLIIDKEVYIAGWGATEPTEKEYPTLLLQSKMTVYEDETICPYLFNSSYCAFDPKEIKSTICAGDSGGPLMFDIEGKWTLFGVSSFGVGIFEMPCFNNQSAYFAKVPLFVDWIKSKVKTNDTGNENRAAINQKKNISQQIMFLFIILSTIYPKLN